MEDSTEMESKREKRKRLHVGMEVLSETAERIAPIVGYFPSGYNPEISDQEPDIRVFRNKNRSSRLDLVVRPKDSNVEFVGKSYIGEAAGAQLCTYALGVLDKDTQTLKIVPIASNKIFRLEPRVIKNLSAEGLNEEAFAAGKTERKISDLTQRYGTKQARSKDKKWIALQQQRSDSSARELLDSKILDTDTNNEALEEAKQTAVRNIPPHDCSAIVPEKAYLLDQIILKNERDYLLDILEILQSGVAKKTTFWVENYYPSFVVNRIHRLREIQDEEEKKKLACILSYITHLVNFWKLASSFRRPTSNLYGDAVNKFKIPRIVYQKFMTLFVDPVSNMLSTEKKELLIGYILVLTLFADRFRTDASDIEKDLGVTHSFLKPYYLHLGCKPSQQEFFSKPLLTLPAPLQFAEIKKWRRH